MLGYRTLVFAERYLTADEYDTVEEMYLDAISKKDRKGELKKLAEHLEQDLTLLGCTVVEDSLQEGVKYTISKCLEADIKVWMITGDKLETAENIGSMAGILREGMRILYIDDYDRDTDFLNIGHKILPELQTALDDGVKSGLIIDMRSIGKKIFSKS
jgi:phospholipid-transporting ATPase